MLDNNNNFSKKMYNNNNNNVNVRTKPSFINLNRTLGYKYYHLLAIDMSRGSKAQEGIERLDKDQ